MPRTTAVCSRNDTRQLVVVVIRPPMSGPAAAPMPPAALMAPNAFARAVISLKKTVAKMYTGGMSSAVPMPCSSE